MKRNTRYIDRRTGSNVVNMSYELSDVAERLALFGFDGEAAQAESIAFQLAALGSQITEQIGDRRLRLSPPPLDIEEG